MKVKIPISILLLFLAILGISGYIWYKDITSWKNTLISEISALNDSITAYKKVILGKETLIFEKNAIILSQDEAIRVGLIERGELRKLNVKNLNEINYLKGIIEIIKDSSGIVNVIHDTIEHSSKIVLPFYYPNSDEFHSFSCKIDTNGVFGYKIQVPLNLKVFTHYVKQTPKTTVTTTNPYVKIGNIETIITPIKRHKYNFSVYVGYGIGLKEFKPQPIIGVGIGRTLFSF
jgi:outer membrane phospholipase A